MPRQQPLLRAPLAHALHSFVPRSSSNFCASFFDGRSTFAGTDAMYSMSAVVAGRPGQVRRPSATRRRAACRGHRRASRIRPASSPARFRRRCPPARRCADTRSGVASSASGPAAPGSLSLDQREQARRRFSSCRAASASPARGAHIRRRVAQPRHQRRHGARVAHRCPAPSPRAGAGPANGCRLYRSSTSNAASPFRRRRQRAAFTELRQRIERRHGTRRGPRRREQLDQRSDAFAAPDAPSALAASSDAASSSPSSSARTASRRAAATPPRLSPHRSPPRRAPCGPRAASTSQPARQPRLRATPTTAPPPQTPHPHTARLTAPPHAADRFHPGPGPHLCLVSASLNSTLPL